MTYPSYPASDHNSAPHTGPTPPSSVNLAFWIYILAAVMSVVSLFFVFTSDVFDKAVQDAANQTSGMSQEDLANTARIIAIVTAVVFIGLYLLFAFKMRAGRNWARVVLTVLSALSIVSQLTSGSQEYVDPNSQVVGWISAALGVVAIVAMYLAPSNAYFNESRTARARAIAG